jgi:tetratricopeptide (TPR) repeat protein
LNTASNYLDKALYIFNKLGERMSLSIIYTNYGSIYRIRKEWDKATDYFEEAIDICKELDTLYNYGNTLFEYGLMFKDKGDTNEAKTRLIQALDIFESIQNKVMINKVENELSVLHPTN